MPWAAAYMYKQEKTNMKNKAQLRTPPYDFSKSNNRSVPYVQPHGGFSALGNSTFAWHVSGGGKILCRRHLYWAKIHEQVSK